MGHMVMDYLRENWAQSRRYLTFLSLCSTGWVQVPRRWQRGAAGPLREAMLGLSDAGPNSPTARARPGPAVKMAVPWEKWFKKGQNAAQRGVQHREQQGQRRRCPKAKQGESLRRPSGREKQLCMDHNHSLIPPALLWACKAARSADIEPAKESRKGVVALFVFVSHYPNLF